MSKENYKVKIEHLLSSEMKLKKGKDYDMLDHNLVFYKNQNKNRKCTIDLTGEPKDIKARIKHCFTDATGLTEELKISLDNKYGSGTTFKTIKIYEESYNKLKVIKKSTGHSVAKIIKEIVDGKF